VLDILVVYMACHETCSGKGCPEGKNLTEDQKKMLMAMQKKAIESRLAMAKALEPFNKEGKKLFEVMKKCKKCKETKYTFDPCDEHLEELKKLTERVARVQLGFQLKQQLARFK